MCYKTCTSRYLLNNLHIIRNFNVFKPCDLGWLTQCCHHVHKLRKYTYASFVCTIQVLFLLSPFLIVSVAVWITLFARFERCLKLFHSIIKHWSTGAKLFRIWKKHVIKRTSNTNTCTVLWFVCVYASRTPPFIAFSQFFQSLFGSVFSIAVWIYFNHLQNTGAMELNYSVVFEHFFLLPFLASVSRPQSIVYL